MLYRARSLKSGRGCKAPGFHPTLKGPRSPRPGEGLGRPRALHLEVMKGRGALCEADLGGGPLPLPMSTEGVGVGVGEKGPWGQPPPLRIYGQRIPHN